jgi:DNA-binding winged helix-turn-helix (wHTH) protein
VFVRKLRQKLQRHSANWTYIHTHFGIGYRFDPESIGEAEEPEVAEAVFPEPDQDPSPAVHAKFTRT